LKCVVCNSKPADDHKKLGIECQQQGIIPDLKGIIGLGEIINFWRKDDQYQLFGEESTPKTPGDFLFLGFNQLYCAGFVNEGF